MEFFENFVCKSGLNLDNNSSKSDRFHEKDRVLEKKMSSFEKFSNRFFKFEKNSQNLTFFLLERDLFHEIDQIFGQNVGARS